MYDKPNGVVECSSHHQLVALLYQPNYLIYFRICLKIDDINRIMIMMIGKCERTQPPFTVGSVHIMFIRCLFSSRLFVLATFSK